MTSSIGRNAPIAASPSSTATCSICCADGGVEGDEGQPLTSIYQIEVRTHGRYLVGQPPGDEPLPMLVGFHGYKENAEHMLEALQRIRGDRAWLLVSVQALNRFYTRDNQVVASWMTRQDRDTAISDNIAYVASVVSAVRREYATVDTLVYAGFSQGVAMAYRAAAFAMREMPAHGLIVLAGDVPPDVAPVVSSLPPVLIGRGRTDHWYTEAKAAADLETFRKARVQPALHVFEGGHEWDATFIARAAQFLEAAPVATAQDHVPDEHPKWHESR